MRRWGPTAEPFMVSGLWFQVVPGSKSEADLRLEIRMKPDYWRPVDMALGALTSDFFYDNEEVLYPQSEGNQGGQKYVDYTTLAAGQGWEIADAILQEEKRRRRG